MTPKLCAQGTCFYSSAGTFSFLDRCEITKAVVNDAHLPFNLGWDVTGATVEPLSTVKGRYDLEVAGTQGVRLGAEAERRIGDLKRQETSRIHTPRAMSVWCAEWPKPCLSRNSAILAS